MCDAEVSPRRDALICWPQGGFLGSHGTMPTRVHSIIVSIQGSTKERAEDAVLVAASGVSTSGRSGTGSFVHRLGW